MKIKKFKNSLSDRQIFWIRLILWGLSSCVLPIVFIAWRFGIFKTNVSFSGWGIIVVIIMALFVLTLVRWIKKGLSGGYSFVNQCINGFVKIILPLICAMTILRIAYLDIKLLLQVLGCITLCETIGIPLNPLPKWAFENQKNVKDNERKNTIDYAIDEFFKRKP